MRKVIGSKRKGKGVRLTLGYRPGGHKRGKGKGERGKGKGEREKVKGEK
jgi:hypothetical protein